MGCYEFTTASPALVGDGHVIAYRAGAEMVDMEFIQFIPQAVVWPLSLRGEVNTPLNLLESLHGRLYNENGERFMERYAPMQKDYATRAVVARAVWNEIKEGRGSPHGGVYLSFRHLPRNLIQEHVKKLSPSFIKELEENNIDLHYDALEIGLAAHYTKGGCWVNSNCETNIAGLYAAGEVASGKDGANRLGGNSIPMSMSMGIIAGKNAAERANKMKIPKVDWNQVERVKEWVFSPLKRKDGVRPIELKRKIRRIASKYLVHNRNEKNLQKAIHEIKMIKRGLSRLWVPVKTTEYNLEWIESLEVRNMIDIVGMVARSAIMRIESRGAHQREDYPNEDPKWLRHIIIKRVGSSMELKTRPVIFPYVKPNKED